MVQEPDISQVVCFLLVVIPAIITITILFYFYTISIHDFEMDEMKLLVSEFVENIMSHNLTSYTAVFNPDELDKYDSTNEEPYVNNSRYRYRLEIDTYCDYWEACGVFCMEFCDLDENTIEYSTNRGRLVDGQGNCGCIVTTCECFKDKEKIKAPRWEFGYDGDYVKMTEKKFPVSYAHDDGIVPARMTISLYDTASEED